MLKIVFFGSFLQYSVLTLQQLLKDPNIKITGVITTPPRPGDRGVVTKTTVHIFSEQNNLPVFPVENLDTIPKELSKPDFIIVSGFGKLIPQTWLEFPTHMALNAHQSLLPQYPGRFPAEWAILNSEKNTGVTLIKMDSHFDMGDIVDQQSIPILDSDTRETLYTKLYQLSGTIALKNIFSISQNQHQIKTQPPHSFYARQLNRDDGFISWNFFQNYLKPKSNFSEVPLIFKDIPNKTDILPKMVRALTPWPGVWTLTPQNRRLKILNLEPLTVQLEGKTPVLWKGIEKNY